MQGNSPLGLPCDMWFAWGWVGVTVIPFTYTLLVGFLDMLLLSNKSVIFFTEDFSFYIAADNLLTIWIYFIWLCHFLSINNYN